MKFSKFLTESASFLYLNKIFLTKLGNRDERVMFSTKRSLDETWSLRHDGWFKKDNGANEESKLKFRKIKLTTMERGLNSTFNTYKVSYTYLPNDQEDEKGNYKTGTGWLWVSNEPGMPSVDGFAAWMNNQVKEYI